MAEKHTTLHQLELAELRAKSEVLALLVEAFEGVQVGITITLPANGWSGRAQTIQNAGFLADSNYWYLVDAEASDYQTACECGIRADNVTTDGQMTFHCEIVPENALTINIIRLEVET